MNDPNPKDSIGRTKCPMRISPIGQAAESLAILEGALKYGSENYREAPVNCSVYLDAARRHLALFESGEECDPKTGVPHLGSVKACCAIILDAQACGTLIDDRPKTACVTGYLKAARDVVRRLNGLFGTDTRPLSERDSTE